MTPKNAANVAIFPTFLVAVTAVPKQKGYVTTKGDDGCSSEESCPIQPKLQIVAGRMFENAGWDRPATCAIPRLQEGPFTPVEDGPVRFPAARRSAIMPGTVA
jgi:hypothetical protein